MALSLLVLSIAVRYVSGSSPVFTAIAVKDRYYHSVEGIVPLTKSKLPDVNLTTLDMPVKSVDEISSWAAQVGVSLFTVDFATYNTQYVRLEEFFTPVGWQGLQKAILTSGWLAALIDKKLTATAVLQHPPIVTKRGILNGVYSWSITYPILVTYESASETRKENRVVSMVIKRVPADFAKGQVGLAVDSVDVKLG